MSSDATPKGRVLTMRRWPFEHGQCILTPRGNDDRSFGTNLVPSPATKNKIDMCPLDYTSNELA